jgi:hypothetical protein
MRNTEIKTYQKLAKVGRRELRRRLKKAKATTSVKRASIGGEQEQGFEQSFASLAYAYIQDKAPGLIDYMIGFQLVDRNEDNTKSVGVFGYKVGNQWLYSPVFFLNGDLKGHELLYMKNQDSFVPLKENWVNYLINKRPHVLGEGTGDSFGDMGVMQPDLRSLSEHPRGKQGSATFTPPHIKGWSKTSKMLASFGHWVSDTRAAADIEAFATKQACAGQKAASNLDLLDFVSQDPALVKLSMDICNAYPGVRQSLATHYGTDFFKRAVSKLQERTKEAKANVFSARPSKRLLKSTDVLGRPKQAAADTPSSKVKVVTTSTITDNLSDLSEEDRQTLDSRGFLVQDARKGDEVSVVYNTQVEMALQNPDETGVYEVLIDEGKFEKCLVIHNPHHSKGRAAKVTVIKLGSPKAWTNRHKTEVFVRPNEDGLSEKETWADWYASQSDATPEEGGTYLVVSEKGDGTFIFEAEEIIDKDNVKVWWRKHGGQSPSYIPGSGRDTSYDGPFHADGNYDDVVIFNKREGSTFKSVAGCLYLPANSKLIKVKDAPKCKKCNKKRCNCNCDYFSCDHQDDGVLRPGNIADLQMKVLQKVAADETWQPLKIFHSGTEVIINEKRSTKIAGLRNLIINHGLRQKVATQLMREAEVANGKKWYIKYASPYMMDQGGMSPPMDMDGGFGGSDAYSGGAMTQQPYMDEQQVPELSAQNTDPSTYDPMQNIDQGAMQTAQRAQQDGQKEVFDTAMISSMLKAVRKDSLVDRFLGDLMKALDRLGRIMFMFYWHNEEFMDRYGKQDMPELEDTLRNAFEVLGDLCLFLKQKTIEPMADEVGEPKLEEAARN